MIKHSGQGWRESLTSKRHTQRILIARSTNTQNTPPSGLVLRPLQVILWFLVLKFF